MSRFACVFACVALGSCAALCACDRPAASVSVPNNANEGRSSAGSAGEQTAKGAAPASCAEGRVRPPFADGAWSVSSLLCAHDTLAVEERFVLRAVAEGGNACTCPPNVACAPCVPTRILRDEPGAELFVVLRAEFPPGLVNGTRADVPVRLLSWGAPPGAVAQLYWAR